MTDATSMQGMEDCDVHVRCTSVEADRVCMDNGQRPVFVMRDPQLSYTLHVLFRVLDTVVQKFV